ncbi:hypothetical protein DFAR_4060007 [Desulfarculales bacterium]
MEKSQSPHRLPRGGGSPLLLDPPSIGRQQKKLGIRYTTEHTEECFHKSQRAASHRRILGQSRFTPP